MLNRLGFEWQLDGEPFRKAVSAAEGGILHNDSIWKGASVGARCLDEIEDQGSLPVIIRGNKFAAPFWEGLTSDSCFQLVSSVCMAAFVYVHSYQTVPEG